MALTFAFNSLVGNALMMLLVNQDPWLHTPMYLLLRQLSLTDRVLVCTTVPKMAAHYVTGRKFISPTGCGVQIFFLTLGGGECFLLAAMSYEHYVAICHLLRYPILMNWRLCLLMTWGSSFLGAADGLMQASATQGFLFCRAHEIDHFFGDMLILVRLAYTDVYTCCVLMLLVPLSLIQVSYSLTLAALLWMHSTEAHKKAFATCFSHLAVVGLFYGAGVFTYMRFKSYRPANHDKVMSAFYTILTTVLYPLTYHLRNNEVKGALTRLMGQCPALNNDWGWDS